MRTAVFLVLAGLGGGALFGPTAPPQAVAQGDAPAQPYAVGPMSGTPSAGLSCAAASCHGGGRAGEKGSEHSTWAMDLTRNPPVAHDPHARAYRVLFNDVSVTIAKNLKSGPAHTNFLCLKCHAVPGNDPANIPASVTEGVGCAGCHGPDEKWLTTHYLPEWKALSNRQKAAVGFVPTKNLVARASACASCHVGDATREVDHDLIAAGHPRLNFDFATYQFMLPRHWYERDRTKPGTATDPTFEARSWLVGRVAHAEAACKLTADRAKRADPWPEFAESSCVACHHTIVGEKTAYPKPVGRSPGSLPWQPIWPVTRPGDDDSGKAVTALLAAMQRPRPRPEAGAAATAAAMQLEGMRRHLTGLPGADAVALVTAELGRAKAIPAGEWDRDLTEQVYHAAAALERAKMVRGEKTDAAGFAAAAKLLTLPRGTVRFDMTPGAADAVRGLK